VEDAKTAADRERAERQAEAKTEHERLLADRKLLPIYPYREQLLDAVAKYQVVVIVGETGSGKTTQVFISTLHLGMLLHLGVTTVRFHHLTPPTIEAHGIFSTGALNEAFKGGMIPLGVAVG
jgi:hypothetical protein